MDILVDAPATLSARPGTPTVGWAAGAAAQMILRGATIAIGDASSDITLPAEGQFVPAASPTFTVAVSAPQAGGTVEVRLDIDSNPTFASPQSVTVAATAIDGTVPTIIVPPFSLTDGTYYARTQVLSDSAPYGLPSDVRTFTVATTPALTTMAGSINITTFDPTTGYLWLAKPPDGARGDLITLYGQGLYPAGVTDPATVSVHHGGLTVPAENIRHRPAGANAYTSLRRIDSVAITVEHDEVDYAIPPGATAPGALVRVSTPDTAIDPLLHYLGTGVGVGGWASHLGHGPILAPIGAPTTDGTGGVVFGPGARYAHNDATDPALGYANGFTVYAVLRLPSPAADSTVGMANLQVAGDYGDQVLTLSLSSVGSVHTVEVDFGPDGNLWTTFGTGGTIFTGSRQFVELTIAAGATTAALKVDGVTVAQTGHSTSTLDAETVYGLNINAQANGSSSDPGKLWEWVVLPAILSTSARAAWLSYFNSQYGVST